MRGGGFWKEGEKNVIRPKETVFSLVKLLFNLQLAPSSQTFIKCWQRFDLFISWCRRYGETLYLLCDGCTSVVCRFSALNLQLMFSLLRYL